jgi:hypothetical protein
MAHRAGLDGRDAGMGDGPCFAQGGGEPVGGDSVGICRNAHEEPDIRASTASKAVDQQGAERNQHWPLQARLPPSRRHPPADRMPLSHPVENKRSRLLLWSTATQPDHVGQSSYRARRAGCQAASSVPAASASQPLTVHALGPQRVRAPTRRLLSATPLRATYVYHRERGTGALCIAMPTADLLARDLTGD